MGAKQTKAMSKALHMIMNHAAKVKEVAELCGLHTSAIYRNKQYKEWKEKNALAK